MRSALKAKAAAKAPAEVPADDPKAALRAEKRKVLDEAARLRREHSWCESGVNGVLEKLGLSGRYYAPVDVTFTKTMWVPVDGALDNADAVAMVAEDTAHAMAKRAVENLLGRAYSEAVVGSAVVDRELEPENPAKGDWDFTGGGAASGHSICENYNGGGYCTRRKGHTGRHARGDGTVILQTWKAER